MGVKVSHAEISGVSNVDILQLPEHLQVYTDTLIGSIYNVFAWLQVLLSIFCHYNVLVWLCWFYFQITDVFYGVEKYGDD